MELNAMRAKVDTFAERYKVPRVVVYGGGVMVMMLVLCVLVGLFATKRAVDAVSLKKAETGLPPHLAAEQKLPQSPDRTITKEPRAQGSSGSVDVDPLNSAVIPAQPRPINLTERTTVYELQSRAQVNGPWASIGQQVVPTTLADFSLRPLEKWTEMTPTEGAMRNIWTFWIQIPEDGQQIFILHIDGRAEADGYLFIDDQAEPSVKAHLAGTFWGVPQPVTNEMALGLAKGWHKLVFKLGRDVQANDRRTAEAKLYLKASNRSSPEEITPWGDSNVQSTKITGN